jgi:hypothetical protein
MGECRVPIYGLQIDRVQIVELGLAPLAGRPIIIQ